MSRFKTFVLVCLFGISYHYSIGQNISDVARSEELTWYGIDFTKSKFIGFNDKELSKFDLDKLSYVQPSDIQINTIRKRAGKKKIILKTEHTRKNNEMLALSELKYDRSYSIDNEDLIKTVEDYNFSGNGYGVLFLVESVEIISNSIYIWVIYINNADGSVVSSRRYIGTSYHMNVKGGDYYGEKGIELVIKNSGSDLKRYK